MFLFIAGILAAGMTQAGGHGVIVNNDGFSDVYSGYLHDVASVNNYVAKYRGSGVTILEWCVGSGRVNYPSKVTELIGHGCTEFPRRGDKRAVETYRRLIAEGVDLLTVVTQACHELAGIECFASLRAAPEYPTSWMGELLPRMFNATLWWTHPQWRVRGPKGEDRTKLSYAFPQVRSYRLAIVKEMLAHDVDGVNIDFLRHPPFAGYEKPVAEDFQRLYGEDVTKVPASDPRLQDLWCSYMTDFLRSVRREAQAAAQRRGKPVRVSVRIDQNHLKDWGLDVKQWCREGLIDLLEVGQHSLGGYELKLKPFVAMARAHGVHVFASEEATLSGHDLTPEEDRAIAEGKMKPPPRACLTVEQYVERARRWYAQGADGVHIFNDQHNYKAFKALGEL